MRLARTFGLALWVCLGIAACKESRPAAATREECTQVAEHIADLIMADFTANPEAWWDGVTSKGDSGIPPTVTKASFKTWLDSPEGKTWVMQRRGNTLTGTQQGIDPCVENATHAQVACLLAAKDKAAVLACDAKFTPKAASGSSAGSATSEASGSAAATGSGASAP